VLPIKTGRKEEIVAIEIGTHPHFDPPNEFHQDKTAFSQILIGGEMRAHIRSVRQTADEGRSIRAVRLHDILGRSLCNKANSLLSARELEDRSGRQIKVGQNSLRI
jgi:hypothetical protein